MHEAAGWQWLCTYVFSLKPSVQNATCSQGQSMCTKWFESSVDSRRPDAFGGLGYCPTEKVRDLSVRVYVFTNRYFGILAVCANSVHISTEWLQERGGGPSRSEFGLAVGQGGEAWIAAAYTKLDLRLTRRLQFPLLLSQNLHEQK